MVVRVRTKGSIRVHTRVLVLQYGNTMVRTRVRTMVPLVPWYSSIAIPRWYCHTTMVEYNGTRTIGMAIPWYTCTGVYH
jgi:hypothetical protein